MAQKLNTFWQIQRMTAGILYLLIGITVFGAILLSLEGVFTIFHSLVFTGFIIGMVKLAQYPFSKETA